MRCIAASDAELRTAITAMYRMSLRSSRTNDVQKAVDTKLQSITIPVIYSFVARSLTMPYGKPSKPLSGAHPKGRGGGAVGLQPTPESNVDTPISNAVRDSAISTNETA